MDRSLNRTRPGRIGVALWRASSAVSRYFSTSIEGLERLPAGGAMLVGNHALLGIDAWGLFPALYEASGRLPRGLAHRSLFKNPVVAHALNSAGVVPGHRELAVELLRAGEMCICYPGGARDSMKNRDEAYRLKWGNRAGFAHAAAEAGVPVVPVAAIGPDEAFRLLTNRGIVPVKFLDNEVRSPVFLPVARRVPFTFVIGEPIAPPKLAGGEQDPELVRGFAGQVETALQALIDTHRERR